MNYYKVLFSENAKKELKKIDKPTAALILNWLEKNLNNCTNPRQHGKALTANHSGKWRYRVGNYRIIANIQDDKIIILVLKVGHKKDVYE